MNRIHLAAGTRINHSGLGAGTVVREVGGGWSGIDRVVVDFDAIVIVNPGNYPSRHRCSVDRDRVDVVAD